MRRVGEDSVEASRIMLGLLEAVEQNRVQSQRHLAAELGIALGLVNAYLKRCVKKSLVKVRQAPARRYAYYITPQGFAEKSRLTVEYLSASFGMFRQAKRDFTQKLQVAKLRGVEKVILVGRSDLAEIAILCAMEQGIAIVGLVQAGDPQEQFIGLPVFANFDEVTASFDSALITEMDDFHRACEIAVDRLGADRVLVPELLRVRKRLRGGAEE